MRLVIENIGFVQSNRFSHDFRSSRTVFVHSACTHEIFTYLCGMHAYAHIDLNIFYSS